MISNPQHELIFGSLSLIDRAAGEPYWFSTLGEDFSLGSPQPVDEAIQTLLQDGSMVVTRGHDNREVSFRVTIEGSDLAALSEGEAALFVECAKPSTLAWTPPDGIGATTVFEVLTAHLEPLPDDLDELRFRRTYRLTLACAPFGRSVSETVDSALVVGTTPTTVTISDGTSATGWTSSYGTISAASGFLRLPTSSSTYSYIDSNGNRHDRFDYDATYTFGTPVDFTATPYLSAEFDLGSTQNQYPLTAPQASADGVELVQVAVVALSNTAKRVTYLCNDSSATTIRFAGVTETATISSTPPSVSIKLDNVTRTNQPPNASTTGRESMRTINIGGSARTQGSLSLSHESTGLGDVILYTTPTLATGYTPDLRRWRTDGNTVTDYASGVSGKVEALGGLGVTFNVPAAPLPRGGYIIMARMRATGSVARNVNVSWTAETKIGTALFGTQSGTSDVIALDSQGTFKLAVIGGVVLPTVDVAPGSAASVQIKLGETTGTEYDEAWLFYVGDDSALSIVSCGIGTPALGQYHNRLWVDTPTLERPVPSIWLGTLADRSDAFHAGSKAQAWGMHNLQPGQMTTFVVSTGAANPALSLRHFPRWFTHAVA